MNSKNPTIPAVNSPPHETPRGAAAGTNQHGASDNSQRPSVSLNCRLAMWRKNSTLEIYCFSSALCFPLDEFFFVLPIFIPFYRACWTMETAKTRIIFHWSQRLASGQTMPCTASFRESLDARSFFLISFWHRYTQTCRFVQGRNFGWREGWMELNWTG